MVRADVSIAVLYPQYLETADMFRCPAKKTKPDFRVNIPLNERGEPVTRLDRDGQPDVSGIVGPSEKYLWANRNYTLAGSSYGYDCRIHPRAVSNHAIAGDMDGSYAADRKHSKQNHEGGQNVLFVDGHVGWEQGNYASNAEADNIYAEEPWSADTDSYLIRATAALGISYDDYRELSTGP